MFDKPQNDKRQYEIFDLPNKLHVLLIHDPDTHTSGAAMNVHVGHMFDDRNVQGLAHFLEHMLFLGTKKYPVEGEYKKYIKQHGGGCNAYTSTDTTSNVFCIFTNLRIDYHFDIESQHFEQALDRFSQFFICPLFNQEGVDREVNAINSEYSKNVQTDSRRFFQLLKKIADPKHPFATVL